MATNAGAQILGPILHGVAISALRSAPPAPHNPGVNSQISPTDGPLTPGFPNQPVGSDTLIITEANGGNVPLSGLEIKQDSENWLFDFKVWQKLAVNVKPAVGDRRLGHTVGLVQTLLSSTRRITYAGGGASFIPGGQPPPGQNGNANGPWLDADQTNLKQHPWYRDTCEGKVMKADQMETYVMEDNPTFNVPIVAFDKTKTKHALTGVSVREVFLISLYDQDVNRLLSEKVGSNPTPLQPVIKQWTWQYEYAMNVTATGYTPDPLTSVTSRAILVPTPRQDIPLAGNVANANPPWFKFDDPSWVRYAD